MWRGTPACPLHQVAPGAADAGAYPVPVRPLVVGFDLDMTLIDTVVGFAATLDALGAELGVRFPTEDLTSQLGPPLDHLLSGHLEQDRIDAADAWNLDSHIDHAMDGPEIRENVHEVVLEEEEAEHAFDHLKAADASFFCERVLEELVAHLAKGRDTVLVEAAADEKPSLAELTRCPSRSRNVCATIRVAGSSSTTSTWCFTASSSTRSSCSGVMPMPSKYGGLRT